MTALSTRVRRMPMGMEFSRSLSVVPGWPIVQHLRSISGGQLKDSFFTVATTLLALIPLTFEKEIKRRTFWMRCIVDGPKAEGVSRRTVSTGTSFLRTT